MYVIFLSEEYHLYIKTDSYMTTLYSENAILTCAYYVQGNQKDPMVSAMQ